MSKGFVKLKLEGADEVQRELEKLAKKAGIAISANGTETSILWRWIQVRIKRINSAKL